MVESYNEGLIEQHRAAEECVSADAGALRSPRPLGSYHPLLHAPSQSVHGVHSLPAPDDAAFSSGVRRKSRRRCFLRRQCCLGGKLLTTAILDTCTGKLRSADTIHHHDAAAGRLWGAGVTCYVCGRRVQVR